MINITRSVLERNKKNVLIGKKLYNYLEHRQPRQKENWKDYVMWTEFSANIFESVLYLQCIISSLFPFGWAKNKHQKRNAKSLQRVEILLTAKVCGYFGRKIDEIVRVTKIIKLKIYLKEMNLEKLKFADRILEFLYLHTTRDSVKE